MAGRSVEQRLTDVQDRIRQLEARKQLLAQQVKQQHRKDRTRTLIQIGAVVSKLGLDTLEKAQSLQREAERRPEVQEWLRKVAERAARQDQTTE